MAYQGIYHLSQPISFKSLGKEDTFLSWKVSCKHIVEHANFTQNDPVNLGIEPRTYLFWDNGTNQITTVALLLLT